MRVWGREGVRGDGAPLHGYQIPRAAVRTGIGYDSHRFTPGGPMRLGGVDIPADVRLTGHSDADAICHAVTDALLGAAGLGDIGEMFPDTDPAHRNADSIVMLASAHDLLRRANMRVDYVDVTVVAERPKIGPHREAIRSRLAETLACDPAQVSVKGKTNEGMGWVGRGEGLAVMAVATVVHESATF